MMRRTMAGDCINPQDAMAQAQPAHPNEQVLEAEVIGSTVVNESVLQRLLRRAGRSLARPALLCLELLRDANTPPQVRLTVLAALTYLFIPIDLIPDFIPGAGFSDDLVALSALLALCGTHCISTRWAESSHNERKLVAA